MKIVMQFEKKPVTRYTSYSIEHHSLRAVIEFNEIDLDFLHIVIMCTPNLNL